MSKIQLPGRITTADLEHWACSDGMKYFQGALGGSVPATRATVRRIIEGPAEGIRYLRWFVSAASRVDDDARCAADRYFARVSEVRDALADCIPTRVLRVIPVRMLLWDLAYYLHRNELAEFIDTYFDLPD